MQRPELARARELRRDMTRVEWRVWECLRARRMGVKFRRQHPIGPYVADFACVSARLVVELDGETHSEAYDMHRDLWLAAHGWRVMRFYLSEVDDDLDSVVEAIRLEVEAPRSMLRYEDRIPDIGAQS